MGQPSTAAKSRWRKETLSLRWEHPGKTLHFAPPEHVSYTSCQGRTRRPRGHGHGSLGICFPASCTGISGAAERIAFLKNLLFHSDQLKEIKLRCPLLTNSDLQVGGQGECHPCCCPVAMELLTATGLRLGLGRCAVRGPAAPPTCLPQRDTEPGLSGCVFNGVKSTWFVYFFL